MNEPTEIIVHCSATKPDWMEGASDAEKFNEIRRWHLARGFNDIGYHWIIFRSGRWVAGRDESVYGAHVKGHNVNTIGICLLGGFGSEADDYFQEHFTVGQKAALVTLIQDIRTRHNIKKISGHNQYANKACPGFRVNEMFDSPLLGEKGV